METAGEEALHLQGFSPSRQNSKFIGENMTPNAFLDLAGHAFTGGGGMAGSLMMLSRGVIPGARLAAPCIEGELNQ